MEQQVTTPAKKTYCVLADHVRRMYQHVEASSPQEAYALAEEECDTWEDRYDFEDREDYHLLPEVEDLATGEIITIAGDSQADLRQASQHFYDAVQRYLMGTPDSELPGEMVEAMNELEAAWHKADGTKPEEQ